MSYRSRVGQYGVYADHRGDGDDHSAGAGHLVDEYCLGTSGEK